MKYVFRLRYNGRPNESQLSGPAVSNSRTAINHVDGLEQWCLAAGPGTITAGFAFQVFEDIRWFIVTSPMYFFRARKLTFIPRW